MVKRIIGLMVIVTGVLLLLSNLEIVVFDDLSGLVFSMGIMIIGIAGLIERRRFDFVLSMFVIFGGLYFSSNIGLIEQESIDLIFWPIVIMAIGLSLLFSVTKRIHSDKPVTSYVAIFSGVEDKNISKEYVSSEITAIFGGATVMVPEDVKVTVRGLPMFGGAENKTVSNETAKTELVINYNAIFGGVEIKN